MNCAESAFRCDLTKHEILYHRVKWSLEKAVQLGRADILQRNRDLWKNVVPKENLIHLASKKGYLNVVQWLHENRSEGCTHWAMDWAAENGHLDVVKYLEKFY